MIIALTTRKVIKTITVVKSKSEFKKKLTAIAKSLGIPPDIVVPQAALESGWGVSGLTKKANNLFGMTAGSSWIRHQSDSNVPVKAWSQLNTGNPPGTPVIHMPTVEYSKKTPEKIKYWDYPGDIISKKYVPTMLKTKLVVNRPFREYADWTESVQDWFNKISSLSRYNQAFEALQNSDIKAYSEALQKGGYATDPNYAKKIQETAKQVSLA